MNIALATSSKYPALDGGETRFFDAMTAAGLKVRVVVWDDESVDWSIYTHVIIRSCWDYHLHVDEFLAWVSKLEKANTTVFNNPEYIRWNSHKSYLLDLAKKGVQTPHSVVITNHTFGDVDATLQSFPSSDIIIKPCYGAGAHGVSKFMRSDPKAKQHIAKCLIDSDVIVQSFIPEVANGEISAIFFGNEFSHAVIKKPKPGDYRSNYEFGGRESSFQLPAAMKQKIIKIYQRCAIDTLYARIDIVDVNNNPILMELELIEPYLFFEYDDSAAQLLTQQFIDKVSND